MQSRSRISEAAFLIRSARYLTSFTGAGTSVEMRGAGARMEAAGTLKVLVTLNIDNLHHVDGSERPFS